MPYWGKVDAMHQFCEAKYVWSPYVAEFWNALTNVPFFILPGLLSFYRGKGLDIRLMFCWFNVILVGVGSFMFHTTMRFKWEMLDELPMLLLVFGGILSKDDTHWITSGSWKVLVHLVSLCLALGGFFLYLSGDRYDVFVHTFTLMVVIDASLAFVCTSSADKHGSWVARGLVIAYSISIAAARVFWEIEVAICPSGSGGNLQIFHVFWHMLAGLACYLGTVSAVHLRYSELNIGAAVDAPGDEWALVGLLGAAWRRPIETSKDE